MLSENIKTFRKAKGLSQEELALRLNVVRQTVSKWERAASVPDAGLLIALSDVLETPVSVLLGERAAAPEPDGLAALAEKLETVNLTLARQQAARRRALRGCLWGLCALILAGAACLWCWGSPYLGWNYGDPETAVLGTAAHALEWAFVRIAPPALALGALGLFLTRRRAD